MRACLLALAMILPANGQTPPVFSSGVEAVRVDVAVTRGDLPVPGLTAADFELREDGLLQALELVSEEKDAPLEATLLLDLSASVTGERLRALRQAGLAFLGGLALQDQAALIAFSHPVSLVQPLTGDLDKLRSALLSLEGAGSTALHDALAAALIARAPTHRRAALVVFSDGDDTASWLADPGAVEELARRGDATIYAVLPGTGAPIGGPPNTEGILARLANATGGRVFEARGSSNLSDTFLRVLHHLRGRYLLTYTPSSAKPGWHRLELRLKRGKGEVLVRPGYWRAPPYR